VTATEGVRAVLQASCVPVWGHVWYSNWLALHIKGHSADAKRTLITLRVCVCIVRYRCRNIRRKIILNSRKTLWKPVRALSLICRRSRDNLEFRTRYNIKLWKACWLSYVVQHVGNVNLFIFDYRMCVQLRLNKFWLILLLKKARVE
jgi:hypothetical protein